MASLIFSSTISSLFVLIFLGFRKLTEHHYSSRFFYGIWIILLLRLIVPMNIFSDVAPINIDGVQMINNLSHKESLPKLDRIGGGKQIVDEGQVENNTQGPGGENLSANGSSTQPAEQGKTQISLPGVITIIWFAGFLISVMMIGISYMSFRRKIMNRISSLSSEQVQATQGLIDTRIRVFVTKDIQSPMVMGLINPRLILTESLFEMDVESSHLVLKEGASEVISHELIHLKRKDILLKYLYLVARSIHWFNPVVYIIGPVINEDIELSCDEHLAKSMNPEEKKQYCRIILNLASEMPKETNLYSTNFNGGLQFMKKRFSNIIKSGKKKRGIILSVLLMLVITASGVLISCNNDKNNVKSNEFVGVPSYHLFQYRSEPADLFYESDERIGLQVLNGIFIYNFKKDKMEAEFALSPEAFEKNFYVSAAMSENEKIIMIMGYNPSSGVQVDYYYEYNILKKTIKRINKNPEEVKTLEHPSFEHQDKVLKADSWDVLDLRYYPEGKDIASYPFKKESLPYKTYIMQMEDDKIPFGILTLTDDGRFVFTYSALMNYPNFGDYKIEGSKYTLNTSDLERTFVFTQEGESLIFNEAESYECILDNREKMRDGTVFALEK